MTKCQYQQCKRVLNTRVEPIKQKWKSNKINTYKLLTVSCLHIHQAYIVILHYMKIYFIISSNNFKRNNQYIIV